MLKIPKIPKIPANELSPIVLELLEILHIQQEMIQQLKDEIARLKGQKPKPKIKPSTLEKPCPKDETPETNNTDNKKRPGSSKRKKTKALSINETKIIKPVNIPEGSRFKGYSNYVVQDIIIKVHNTQYRVERWQTPDGNYVKGKLPDEVSKSHFGTGLISFILYQYCHCHVTQPLILEELREFGVDISSGQLNRIITENKERFHKEKEEILRSGLEISKYCNVDDTGSRHNGKNGYCTHIGNELFAWFESTGSKSRINFLELLSAGNINYVLNADALEYMLRQKFPKYQLDKIAELLNTSFDNEANWKATLEELDISSERHVRIVTEGALVGNIIENGFNKELVIVSDDAGQFNVFEHALCWIHAERSINKLVGFNKEKRSEIWDFYAELKAYKLHPDTNKKAQFETRFDEIFIGDTCFASLNQALKMIWQNKPELLLVLEHPDIPLHNNLSERDIREYVKKRKISGSTRSDEGRRCRDTFTSLKKTCRKLKISFWKFLNDRIMGKQEIALLPELIFLKAQETVP